MKTQRSWMQGSVPSPQRRHIWPGPEWTPFADDPAFSQKGRNDGALDFFPGPSFDPAPNNSEFGIPALA